MVHVSLINKATALTSSRCLILCDEGSCYQPRRSENSSMCIFKAYARIQIDIETRRCLYFHLVHKASMCNSMYVCVHSRILPCLGLFFPRTNPVLYRYWQRNLFHELSHSLLLSWYTPSGLEGFPSSEFARITLYILNIEVSRMNWVIILFAKL